MTQRTRILIAEKDLNSLSRIYLALLHRNYKVEATNLTEEIADRTKRLKPSLTILGYDEYQIVKEILRTPAIVLYDDERNVQGNSPADVVWLLKNVSIEKLISTIEEMVY